MTNSTELKMAEPPCVATTPLVNVQDSELAAIPPIVGIGASAGGLEAFEQFFRACPLDSDLAFVLVPHLDPGHDSLLSEILQRSTAMPVAEATDRVTVAANCVYIIPPNREMAILNGVLQLSEPTQARGRRLPIDAFLRSLADDRAESAIGVILSGTANDGTQGLRAILKAGGICMVQEPSTARYDSMPQSAITAGYATHILPVDRMPAMLIELARQSVFRPKIPRILSAKTASNLQQILQCIYRSTGHDFSLYKKSTISRRIERRMIQHNIDDMAVYARFLEHYPAEVQTLFKELLINVTCFFRDPDAFHVLKQDILPQLLAGQPDNYLFRVWVAGCASGEEAYSIAIVLRELMEEMQQQFREFRVQIYATDLDEDSIAEARSGSYLPNIALDVTPERLQRFFNKEEGEQGAYRIKKEIREMVVFAVQSVIKDPPFTKLDLLSCRNLLIYLEPEQQARLIPVFHYALKPGGVLFLSSSESIAEHADLFSVINRKCKFYRAAPAVHLSRRTTSHPATAPRPAASSWHAPKVTQRARKKRSQLAIDPAEAERAEHMARELAFAKDNLQATVEDQHANNEELQSANEEMHSSNEELLSANEELETSREELQSLNEELMTVNTELHANIELLHEAKSDLRNLFDNIYVGTLFLDDRLCIRRYTRELLKIYPLIASDIGRPLRDIKPNFVGGSLLAEMQAVLDTLTPFERQIRTVDGQWFLAHIQPYRSLDNRVKGIVLSFVNISAMKRAQNLARDLAEGIATLVDEPLIVLDGDLQIVSANASFYRYFQIDAQETVGRKIYDLGDGQWNIPALRQLIEEILPHNRALEGYVVEHDFPGLGARRLLVNARSIVTEQGNSGLILLAIEKIEIIQMIKTTPTTPAIQTLELP